MHGWTHQATPYQVLGVPRDASTADITHAFRIKVKGVHPDRSAGSDAAALTRRLIEARDLLLDATARCDYDHLHDSQQRFDDVLRHPPTPPRAPDSGPPPYWPAPTPNPPQAATGTTRGPTQALRRWQGTGWTGGLAAGLSLYLTLTLVPVSAVLLSLFGVLSLWTAHRRGGFAGVWDRITSVPSPPTWKAAVAAYAAQFTALYGTALLMALADCLSPGEVPVTALFHAALIASTAQLLHRLHTLMTP